MSRLVAVLAAALALVSCSKKEEVVVAAPVSPAAQPSDAQGPAMAPAQPGPVQGNESLPPGHPPLDGAGAAGTAPAPDAGMGAQPMPPHGGAMSSSAADVGEVKVPKATGKDARTIAEIYAQRQALKDRTVTVRGKVVKYTAGVMGKNWIHLRDGSGTPGKDNDVTVTSQDAAAKGEVVVVQGKVAVDQDIGMGTPYQVMIQDAKVSR
ncbi:MAG TPA: hypothetical protein VMK66_11145 [Myxococcales bacterium]|nr:hypothetical protein [Myxococcales bacterium]